MKRPTFQVTTGVLVVLVLVGFSKRLLERFIPPDPPNSLQGSFAPFLVAGENERIDWRPYGPAPFEEARRLGKPILFVAGAPWSALGRLFDKQVFNDLRIQKYLARNCVCVRVDVTENPAWTNAFLPLSRVKFGFLIGFQAWILDSKGVPVQFVGQIGADQHTDSTTVLVALIHGVDAVANIANDRNAQNPIVDAQLADLNAVSSSFGIGLPNFADFSTQLSMAVDPAHGGFPQYGFQRIHAPAWQFQTLTGDFAGLRASLDPVLKSSIVDWLDGGFFRMSADTAWNRVQCDKLAVQNAEMMQVLYQAALLTGAKSYRDLADRTFDCLRNDFVANDLIFTCQRGDEDANGRCKRASFSPRRLRDAIPDDSARAWAQDNLGLRTGPNPEMLPRVADLSIVQTQAGRFNTTLEELRAAASTTPAEFHGSPSMDVNGYVAARMMETSRMNADAAGMAFAASILDRLDAFRSGSDVAHTIDGDHEPPYLGDYLAYSDAALQDYLASGRAVSLERGLSVLQRAIFIFAGSKPGVLGQMSAVDSAYGPQVGNPPEIVDNVGPSCTALLIRLAFDYGRILIGAEAGGQSDRAALGNRLAQTAFQATGVFAPIVAGMGPQVAGYYCAAAPIQDSDYVIAAGPNSVALANELYRLRPTRLIAPVLGSGKGKAPGLYLSRRGQWHGPLTVQEAADTLLATLDLNTPGR